MSNQVSESENEKNTNSLLDWIKRYRGMSDTFVFWFTLDRNCATY